jgi:hypothetical protein
MFTPMSRPTLVGPSIRKADVPLPSFYEPSLTAVAVPMSRAPMSRACAISRPSVSDISEIVQWNPEARYPEISNKIVDLGLCATGYSTSSAVATMVTQSLETVTEAGSKFRVVEVERSSDRRYLALPRQALVQTRYTRKAHHTLPFYRVDLQRRNNTIASEKGSVATSQACP